MSRLKDHLIGLQEELEQEICDNKTMTLEQLIKKYSDQVPKAILTEIWENVEKNT
jgi:predicted metal-dependent phosphoesterase TrpH